uniref:RUN domain-containing protein n=1 Tax=Steinernema glaseri TaxID=37863 RepID=A0A1I8A735_9BILA
MDLWKLEMIVREFRSLVAQRPELNSQLRDVSIGDTYLFGTFGDLIDLYFFKSMKAGAKSMKAGVVRRRGKASHDFSNNNSISAEVQDNDVPVFSRERSSHQEVPAPRRGDCSEVGQLFEFGSDNLFPLTRSLNAASDRFERLPRNQFRNAISRIHNKLLVSQLSLSTEDKVRLAVRELKEFVGYNPMRSNLISTIPLGQWGTVKQLFEC